MFPVETRYLDRETTGRIEDAVASAIRNALATESGSALVFRDEQGQPLPPEALPQHRVARGQTFTMEFTLPPQQGTERPRRFEARGRPIRAGHAAQGGLVVIRPRKGHAQ